MKLDTIKIIVKILTLSNNKRKTINYNCLRNQ